ncbi:MAG: flavin reductase family protein [Variovorax sp.]
MADFVSFDAAALDSATIERLLLGCVVPRPVAWITTQDAQGRVNAAPFSSYNFVAQSPPMLAVNIASLEGRQKDTARNLVAEREFVVNVATVANIDAIHACGAVYPHGASELEALGLGVLPSRVVSPPRIACTPVQMECRLIHVLPLGLGVNTLYIGEVVAFHLSPEVFDGKYVDSVKLKPLARLGGPLYAGLGEIFHRAPVKPLPLPQAQSVP